MAKYNHENINLEETNQFKTFLFDDEYNYNDKIPINSIDPDKNHLSPYYKDTPYQLEDDFNTILNNQPHSQYPISLLHLNIRSSVSNLTNLENYLNNINPKFKIIGLTETWLTNENKHCHNLNEDNMNVI